VGASETADFYGAFIYDLPNNAAYEGPFYFVDASGSVGLVGGTAGYFADPFNVNGANGVYAGWAPGLGAGLSDGFVYYYSLATYNSTLGELTFDYP
jgi:hypothetical protein